MCLVVVLLEEAVEGGLLSNGQFAGLDTRVVHTEERIDVVHRLSAHIGELLDLGGGILDLKKYK